MNIPQIRVSGTGSVIKKVPQVCVSKLLTEDQAAIADEIAIIENPDNRKVGPSNNMYQLAVYTSKRWAVGRTLRVGFLNGTVLQLIKCQRWIKTLEEFANIKFDFVIDGSATDIRIAFYDGTNFTDSSSWSYLGTDALLMSQTDQTINFGWLDDWTPDFEWKRVVLHEICHALGFGHELQSPNAHVNWNKDKVYEYYTGPPNNWTIEQINHNIFDIEKREDMEYTEFDPSGIMCYGVPAEFTMDNISVPGGRELSALDKEFLAKIYPFNQLIVDGPEVRGTINATDKHTLPFTVIDGIYQLDVSPANMWINVKQLQDGKLKTLKYWKGHLELPLKTGSYETNFRVSHGPGVDYTVSLKEVKK